MLIETRLFGPIDTDEDRVFLMEGGLPGLAHLERFVLIETEDRSPWKWLQSVDDRNMAFVVIDPFCIFPGYAPELSDADREALGLGGADEAAYLALAVVPEKIEDMTVNLRAPLAFNPARRRVRQVILNDDSYAIKHQVFSALLPGIASEKGSRVKVPVAAMVSGR